MHLVLGRQNEGEKTLSMGTRVRRLMTGTGTEMGWEEEGEEMSTTTS